MSRSSIRSVAKIVNVVLRRVYRLLRSVQSRAQVRRLVRSEADVYVEIGAGYKKGANGWVTLDLSSGSDICWDLRKGLPFPDGTVHALYSSHLLEHLTHKETQILLRDVLRALKPGGTFSVCVPNAQLYLEAYATGRALDPEQFFGYTPAFNDTTRIDMVNYTAYMDGQHKYMWDMENLLHVLRGAGFGDVQPREFDAMLDMPERDFESIYAVATR